MAAEAPVTTPATTLPPTPRADSLRIAGLYLAAVLLYALLGRRQLIPLISPDEFTYGHLARSLADGHGFTWRGEDVPFRAALYIYAITDRKSVV